MQFLRLKGEITGTQTADASLVAEPGKRRTKMLFIRNGWISYRWLASLHCTLKKQGHSFATSAAFKGYKLKAMAGGGVKGKVSGLQGWPAITAEESWAGRG